MTTRQIRRFRRALHHFERIAYAQLKTCCARVTLAQCLVLLEIDENEQLTMSQLAAGLRLDNSTLSRTVEGLVQRKLVERRREDRDRRVVRIRLTADGAAVCRSIHEENDGLYARVLERIPASRRGTVIKNFETLVQAFSDHEVEALAEAPGVERKG